MNAGRNIMAAFKVVEKTYANLSNLMKELDKVANENNLRPLLTRKPDFLRYHSDLKIKGWYYGSFIKLYQEDQESNGKKSNGLAKGPIFGIRIQFFDSIFEDSPEIVLCKYSYEGIPFFNKRFHHGHFSQPLYDGQVFKFTILQDNKFYSEPLPSYSEKYGSLVKVSYIKKRLMDVKSENVKDYIVELKKINW